MVGAPLLISILALPSRLSAEDVVVSVSAEQLVPEAAATITLVSVGGDGEVVGELGAPGVASVRTAVEGLQYVSCRSGVVWCPQLRVGALESGAVDAEAPPVRVVNLTAHPLADLALPLVLPSGESFGTGTALSVEGWLEVESGTLHFVEAGTLDGNLLRWRGPAGRTDYRIAMEGWAPRYLFDRDIGRGVVQLEPLRLVRGSSVSLHALEESGLPVGGADVRAESYPPLAEDGTGPVAARAVTSEDGFAQLVGLDGEYYSLIVESEGRPPTRIEGLRLAPDAETRLADVVLSEFAEVRVFISPQAPSTGRWRVALQRLDQGAAPLMAEANPSGVATLRLATGSYLLDLQTPDGDVLHSETRQVAGAEAVAIDLDFVEVRGQVRLDGDGVQAQVALSRGAGDRVPFVTNEDGEFGGQMPRPKGDSVAAAVETAGGLRRMFMVKAPVDDDVLSLRLNLGDRAVRGVVLDGSTLEPLPGASVRIERADEVAGNGDDDLEMFVSLPVASDQEGRFAFDGLEEGRYRLWAWLDGFTEEKAEVPSSPLEGWVVDDVRTVRLRLQSADPLDVLLTRGGSPLPAAMVEVVARSRSGAVGAGFGATDGSGRARVFVPRDGVGPASVVIEASPDFLWSGCASLPSPGEPILRLDLMDEPIGTVVLRNTADDAAGGFSDPVLVTPHGGVLSLSDLIGWSSRAADADLWAGDWIDRIELPGLSAGRYRVVQSTAVDFGLYADACAGALNASAGDGKVLVPGGRVEFEVDLGFGADEPVLMFPPDL